MQLNLLYFKTLYFHNLNDFRLIAGDILYSKDTDALSVVVNCIILLIPPNYKFLEQPSAKTTRFEAWEDFNQSVVGCSMKHNAHNQ